MKNNIIVIIGPTCTGKTSLSHGLCKKFNGEIISADSRQLYKHMDIGTGKLPIGGSFTINREDKMWSLDGVSIWGYDIVTPDKYYSAYDFGEFSMGKIRELLEEGKNVFLVGGTGFYIDVVTGRQKPAGVKPSKELRKSLESTPTKNLITKLTSLNPEKARKIDQNNRHRLVRALEIELSAEKNKKGSLPYLENVNFVFIGLDSNRDILYRGADLWVSSIWHNGLAEEVIRLRDLGYGNSPRLKGMIYGQVSDFVDGKISEKECLLKMNYAMHAYIRRQQTYFKKISGIKWFDVNKDSYKQNVYNLVERYVG